MEEWFFGYLIGLASISITSWILTCVLLEEDYSCMKPQARKLQARKLLLAIFFGWFYWIPYLAMGLRRLPQAIYELIATAQPSELVPQIIKDADLLDLFKRAHKKPEAGQLAITETNSHLPRSLFCEEVLGPCRRPSSATSMPMPLDEPLRRVVEATLQPFGIEVARGLIAEIRTVPGQYSILVAETDDSGITIEVANDATGREVTYAIPGDGSRRYFSATERGSLRLTGAIGLDLAISNLVRWVRGDSENPSTVGLLLPSRLRSHRGP